MKAKMIVPALFYSLVLFQACGNERNDSVEKAKKANEKKEEVSDTSTAMNTVNEKDAAFMVEAASSGMMEVELGNMAQQKTKHPRIKGFGEMMVREHSNGNEDLKNLASLKNVTLPATMGDQQQKAVDDLRKKTAADFDITYINMMIEDHEDDIRKFEKAANDAKSPDVKAFASKTLPVLRNHLDSARVINKLLKKN